MKKLLFILLLCAGLSYGQSAPTPWFAYSPAGAICDAGPDVAATLLVPYFEVDSADNSGMDTLVGVTNISPYPYVAHVVVWNVDSWPVFDFNIFLTGYDVVTFSMRQILVFGNMPNNGCASSTYKFTTYYVDCDGDGEYFDQAFTKNDGMFSYGGYNMDIACYPTIPAGTLADWQCKLSIGSYDGYNTNFVGYITIDVAVTCNGAFPDSNLNYFYQNYIDVLGVGAGNHSVIENSNIFMGDMFYFDHTHSLADGMVTVNIQAFGEDNLADGHTWGMEAGNFNSGGDFALLGINTFYNKYEYNTPVEANDARQTTPLEWGFRYIGNTAFDGGTWVDIWRSHNIVFDHWYMSGGPCTWGGLGAIYTVLYDLALGEIGLPNPALIAFDEEEHTTQTGGGPSPPPPVPGFTMPLETQRVQVEGSTWPLVDVSGWIAISFDTDWQIFGSGAYGVAFDQSWLNVRYFANNKYSVGLSGNILINSCYLAWDPEFYEFFPINMHGFTKK